MPTIQERLEDEIKEGWRVSEAAVQLLRGAMPNILALVNEKFRLDTPNQAFEKGLSERVLGASAPKDDSRAILQNLDFLMDAHYHFGDWPIVFSLETWNKLPKNFQRIIKECALKIQDETRKAMRAQDQEYIKKLKEAGVEIYTLTPGERAKWAKAARPAWDEWIKLVGKEKADKFFELAEKLR